MGYIGNIIFALVQFCALVLFTIGTPLDQFRARGASDDSDPSLSFSNSFCLTLWAVKDSCYGANTHKAPDVFKGCGNRADYFRAGEACAIITIVVLVVNALFVALTSCCACCCDCFKYIAAVIQVVGVVAACITWGVVVDNYLKGRDVSTDLSDPAPFPLACVKLRDFVGVSLQETVSPYGLRLGTGFVLLVVATALILVNVFIVFIPC